MEMISLTMRIQQKRLHMHIANPCADAQKRQTLIEQPTFQRFPNKLTPALPAEQFIAIQSSRQNTA